MKLEIICMILVVSVSIAYAQESTVTIETHTDTYLRGDTIIVSGNVSAILPGTAVAIQISHQGAIVDVGQVEEVGNNGGFVKIFKAGCLECLNDKWINSGTYDIRATYGEGNIAKIQIEYIKEIPIIKNSNNVEVQAGSHGTFDVGYEMVGGDVTDIRVDMDILGLVVDIVAEEDGTITLEMPRDYIGAEEDGNDIDFIVLIDDSPIEHTESEGVNTRKVTMDTISGNSQIKIIGTYVLPEFGAILFIMVIAGGILVAMRYLPMQKSISL